MTKDIKKKLAKNLRRIRKQRGLTQEELSLALNFDNSYVGKVENAKINITLDKIASIADYLKVEVVDLLR